jgi:hypothetical protein
VLRAELAARAGDTAQAAVEMRGILSQSRSAIAMDARVSLARWQLASARNVADLRDVRSLLLPAVSSPPAQELLRSARTVAALVDGPRAALQPLSLFIGAEIARDELGATALAHDLFLGFAEAAPRSPCAAKALLAALPLAADAAGQADLRARLSAYQDNPYLLAASGSADEDGEFQQAEERLRVALASLRADAARHAEERDPLIGQSLATLDSLRLDSTRVACGAFIDNLRLAGIRADSVLAACIRGAVTRIDTLLQIDTLLLRPDTTGVPRETGENGR